MQEGSKKNIEDNGNKRERRQRQKTADCYKILKQNKRKATSADSHSKISECTGQSETLNIRDFNIQ